LVGATFAAIVERPRTNRDKARLKTQKEVKKLPAWFKLNEDKFMVSIEAITKPAGDLWRYITTSAEYMKHQIEQHKKGVKGYEFIDVTLRQYRDDGYGCYGYAYVTLFGKLRKNGLIVFTRYITEQPPYKPIQNWNKDDAYETLVLWAIDLLKESHRINKIPVKTIIAMGTEITTTEPLYRKIKRKLKEGKRVFYLGCHFLQCSTRYFAFLKPDDRAIQTNEKGQTVVYCGCPRHPNVSAHVAHTIGDLG